MNPERLRQLLDYNKDTGVFRWKVSRRVRAGTIAGVIDAIDGYRRIKVDGKSYKAHRLAFLYVTGAFPPDQVDHVNMIRDDNRWRNLRAASRSENLRNCGPRKSNKCGYKVVSAHGNGKWQADICVNQRSIYLGVFNTPEEAHAAYVQAASKHHKEFARSSCLDAPGEN